MYDLIVLLSRYVFIAYIALFVFLGLVYSIDERNGDGGRLPKIISVQRKIIAAMHITAYAILSYNRTENTVEISTVIIGTAAIVYMFISSILIRSVYKKSCPFIWNGMYFLMDCSMIMLQRLNPALAGKQLVWISVGTAIMLFIPILLKIIPKLEKFELFYLIASLIFIVLPFIFGDEQNGSLNWISIQGIGFQPSEIVKFLFLLYVACIFRKPLDFKRLCIISGYAAFIVICVFFKKDLGGALIFFTTYMLLLYITTSNALLLLGGFGCMSLASLVAYKLFYHVRVRVTTWIDPWKDAENTGYQITQSLFAITTWGFLGSGLTRGLPTKIPVVEKDMIFSAICEEFGTLFGMGVVCIYILLFLRGMYIAVRSKKRFYSILTSGIVIMFAFQTFLIIGGVIKLIPLTGVTMPFVSYGGSSILVSIMFIGLLQWSNSMALPKENKTTEEQDTEELQTDRIRKKIIARKKELIKNERKIIADKHLLSGNRR